MQWKALAVWCRPAVRIRGMASYYDLPEETEGALRAARDAVEEWKEALIVVIAGHKKVALDPEVGRDYGGITVLDRLRFDARNRNTWEAQLRAFLGNH